MHLDIRTAIDSLVALVHLKKSIQLEKAASELGLPENIISEWASFLEEEGIIKITYKFTTPYLVESVKTAQVAKQSELQTIKEVITRKVQVILAAVKYIQVKHTLDLTSTKEVRELLHKNVFRKGKITPDFVYAQKIVLETEAKNLIKDLQQIKYSTKSRCLAKYDRLKRWKKILERNAKSI